MTRALSVACDARAWVGFIGPLEWVARAYPNDRRGRRRAADTIPNTVNTEEGG
ncbi:MAG: hypothetical protein OJF49_001411 [Ktedonobacterales bacterium]|nr:MAG: hypothetical protein OJF49_001411 [Ktedonobacterales bacterium]